MNTPEGDLGPYEYGAAVAEEHKPGETTIYYQQLPRTYQHTDFPSYTALKLSWRMTAICILLMVLALLIGVLSFVHPGMDGTSSSSSCPSLGSEVVTSLNVDPYGSISLASPSGDLCNVQMTFQEVSQVDYKGNPKAGVTLTSALSYNSGKLGQATSNMGLFNYQGVCLYLKVYINPTYGLAQDKKGTPVSYEGVDSKKKSC